MELVLLISQVLGGGTALGHPHEPPVTVEGLLWLVQDILCQSHTKTIPQSLSMQLSQMATLYPYILQCWKY